MEKTLERIVNAERVEDLIAVFGSFDENIKKIEESLGVSIINRGTELKVTGEAEAADKAARTLEGLLSLASKGEVIDEQRVRYLITLISEGNDAQVAKMAKDVVCITAKGKPIKAKTVGQQEYMKAISKNTITLGVGPAGTGKTYLAVAAAVAAFRERTVNRLLKPENGWVFCLETCRIKSIHICVLCMMRCMTCWALKPSRNIRKEALLRLRPLPICAAEPWTIALLFWTKRRIPPKNR